jgi:hypothetical protein
MDLQLLKGNFSANDATNLISELARIKIKYHENKIKVSENIEDIKMRETRIKNIQNELFEIKKHIASKTEFISLESIITIT